MKKLLIAPILLVIAIAVSAATIEVPEAPAFMLIAGGGVEAGGGDPIYEAGPNEVICIIDTDTDNAEADYHTLASAISGETGATPICCTSDDLVTEEEQLTFLLRASDGDADAYSEAGPTIDGFTTNETYYVKLFVDYGHRHSGEWDDTKYRLTQSAYANCLRISDPYTEINGLQISYDATGASSAYGIDANTAVNHPKILNNIVRRTTGTTGYAIAFDSLTDAGSVYIVNNLIYGAWGRSLSDSQRWTAVERAGAIYNNTAIGSDWNTAYNTGNGANLSLINNILQDASFSDNAANIGTTAANISGNTTSPDAAFREIVLDFEDKSGNDYRLASTDTDAIDAGTNLSENATFSFDYDIREASRPQGEGWDIGAFERN